MGGNPTNVLAIVSRKIGGFDEFLKTVYELARGGPNGEL